MDICIAICERITIYKYFKGILEWFINFKMRLIFYPQTKQWEKTTTMTVNLVETNDKNMSSAKYAYSRDLDNHILIL